MAISEILLSALGAVADPGRFSTFYLFSTALTTGIAMILPFVPVQLIGRRFLVLMSFLAIVFFALTLAASGLETGYFHMVCAGLLIAYNVFLPPQTGIDQSQRKESAEGGPRSVAQAVSWSLLVLAGLSGGIGLVLDAVQHPQQMAIAGRQDLWLSVSFVGASLLLGSAATGMVLGHWYLVVRNASFKPLGMVTWILLIALAIRGLVVLSAAVAQEERWNELVSVDGFTGFVLGSGIFILARLGFGLVAPMVMAWMTWKCVQIKSNQSATGILYVILAFVLIGEILAKYFLLSEGLLL